MTEAGVAAARPTLDAMLEFHDFFFTSRQFSKQDMLQRAERYLSTQAWLSTIFAPWVDLTSNWLAKTNNDLILDALGQGWSDQFLSNALRGQNANLLSKADVHALARQPNPDAAIAAVVPLALGSPTVNQ